MKKLYVAAKWMWDHRGHNLWWSPPVLTASNDDPSSPNLNQVEAESVFRLLLERKLIFPSFNPTEKRIVYLLHELKENEWKLFLKEINLFHRWFIKPLLIHFKNIWTAILWLVSIIIASYIGALFNELI